LKTRKWIIVAGFVGAALLNLVAWGDNMAFAWVNIVVLSIFAAAVQTGIFAMTPVAARSPQKVGIAMAVVGIGTSFGILTGSAVYPIVLNGMSASEVPLPGDWQSTALFLLAPLMVVGFIVALFLREKRAERSGK
jgi:predicted MFS family arabinose efflux permease